MSSPRNTPLYPVNESQSFVASALGSASKSNLGKTLPSQSLNFGNLMLRMSENRNSMTPQDTGVSPSRTRIQALGEKFRNINKRAEEDKNSKKKSLMQKINNLQEKVKQKGVANDIQFKILKEQIDRLYDDIDEEKRIREEFEEELESNIYPVPNSNKYMNLEQISTMVLEKEHEARKESDTHIQSIVDEKIFALTLSLAKEKKAREEDEDQYFNDLIEELQALKEEIEFEKNTTEENSEKLIQKLSQEIGSFHEILYEEIENRNKGEENLLKIIEEAQANLIADLEHEKTDREETEEGLVKLLEDTCQRVEHTIVKE